MGSLQPWVGGKDLILYTIGLIGVEGARYQSIEFAGPAISALPMSGRFTMSNMAIEAGGKAGIFAVDAVHARLSRRARAAGISGCRCRSDATYSRVVDIDVSDMEPQVAFPHLPSNARPISQVGIGAHRSGGYRIVHQRALG